MPMRRHILFAVMVLFVSSCSYQNLDYVKERAEKTWASVGYEIIGYEGFQWGVTFTGAHGGAKVWYSLKRDNNGIIYTGFLQRWGDEIHVYGPNAVDAIKPR
jgi:hypothetical protein